MRTKNFPRKRHSRQTRAAARQDYYEQLSLDEKLTRALSRGTDGSREVAKLKKQLNAN